MRPVSGFWPIISQTQGEMITNLFGMSFTKDWFCSHPVCRKLNWLAVAQFLQSYHSTSFPVSSKFTALSMECLAICWRICTQALPNGFAGWSPTMADVFANLNMKVPSFQPREFEELCKLFSLQECISEKVCVHIIASYLCFELLLTIVLKLWPRLVNYLTVFGGLDQRV